MRWAKNIFAALLMFFVTLILAGLMSEKLTQEYLYEDTNQLNAIYDSNKFDYEDFIREVEKLGKQNLTISQYTFTSEDTLNIYTNRPKTYKKSSGGQLKVSVYDFKEVKNIGLGTTFYVRGDSRKVATALSKNMTLHAVNLVKTSAFVLNSTMITLSIFIVMILILLMFLYLQANKKMILIQKTLGYGILQTWIYTMRENIDFIISFIVGAVLGILSSIFLGYLLDVKSYLLLVFGIIVVGILILTVQTIFLICYYHLCRLRNPLSVHYRQMFVTFLLVIFGASIWFSFRTINPIASTLNQIRVDKIASRQWQGTQDIYKTNITNQINRDNKAEEKNYSEKAKAYYQSINSQLSTFIIIANNFTMIDRDPDTKEPIYIGQQVMPNETVQDYITEPFGNSIIVDKNYLKRQNIKIHDSNFFQRSVDKNIVYILVPDKYKRFDTEIIKNYSANAIEKIGYSKMPKFKIIHTFNNQKYFTYNINLGDPATGNNLVDPIAVVFNKNLVDLQTFGNILTTDGGLFFEKNSEDQDAFNLLKPAIKKVGLSNTLNMSVSVYKDFSRYLAKQRSTLLAQTLHLLLLILIDCLLIKEIIILFFELNKKQLIVKWVLGYSRIGLLFDTIFWPLLVILAISVFYQLINYSIINYAFALILIVVSIVMYSTLFNQVFRRNQLW